MAGAPIRMAPVATTAPAVIRVVLPAIMVAHAKPAITAKSPYTCLGGVCGYYQTATGGTSGCPIGSWGCPCDAYGYCTTPLNCVNGYCSTIAVGGSSSIGGGSACVIGTWGCPCASTRLLQSVHLLQRLLLHLPATGGFPGYGGSPSTGGSPILGGYSGVGGASVYIGGKSSYGGAVASTGGVSPDTACETHSPPV